MQIFLLGICSDEKVGCIHRSKGTKCVGEGSEYQWPPTPRHYKTPSHINPPPPPRWGRGWRFSTREGDSGDYWKVTKQRTPGELLARERKVAKTSLFQQLNRVSRKTEVFVFPVLWSPLYKDNDPMSPLMLLRQPSQSSRVHTSGTLVWHIPLKSLSPFCKCALLNCLSLLFC